VTSIASQILVARPMDDCRRDGRQQRPRVWPSDTRLLLDAEGIGSDTVRHRPPDLVQLFVIPCPGVHQHREHGVDEFIESAVPGHRHLCPPSDRLLGRIGPRRCADQRDR
jgi:hypothetical protein